MLLFYLFDFWNSLENSQILLSCVDRYDKQPNNIIWTLLPKITFWNGKSLLGLILSCQNECKLISKLLVFILLFTNIFLISYHRSFQYVASIRFISLSFDNSCLFKFCGKVILVGVLSLVTLLQGKFLWCDKTTQPNLRCYYLINGFFSGSIIP